MSLLPFDVSTVKSLQEKRWLAPFGFFPLAHAIAKDYDLPPEIAHLVAVRMQTHDSSAQDCARFLKPSLREHLPNPSLLHDMERAILRTETAICHGENIGIITDYDVDGTTSGALLLRYFRALGILPALYVPERLKEGYGPSPEAVKKLQKEKDISLLFTLDCGTSAHAALDCAKELGIDVVIIDHHQTESTPPVHHACINPKQPQDKSGLDTLASVGLVFMFLVALNRKLRTHDDFHEPDLKQFLDLVALGTVCDMVPLLGLNRLLVKQGLQVSKSTKNEGLRALIKAANLRNYLTARDLGFSIGPAINAASRMGFSNLATELFITEQPERAQQIAKRLMELNKERRSLTEQHYIAFSPPTDAASAMPEPYIHIANRDVHLGVAGLLATKLAQQHHKPVFVGAIDQETGKVKGSVRSIAGFDIGACLQHAKAEGLLEKAGGHAMAGGFQYPIEKKEPLDAFLTQYFRNFPARNDKGSIQIDTFLPSCHPKSVYAFSRALSVLEPFGMDNPEPVVLLANVICNAYLLKHKPHIVCELTPYGAEQRNALRAFAFQAVGTPLGTALLSADFKKHTPVHALISIQGPSSYNGKPLLRLLDISPIH